jgi:hypothetical protein
MTKPGERPGALSIIKLRRKTMNVYTIFGSTGEYSDRNEWSVISYLDEERAKDHVVRASEKANEWEVVRKNKFTNPPEKWNEYDPEMQMDYTGTSYYYVTTEIADYQI